MVQVWISKAECENAKTNEQVIGFPVGSVSESVSVFGSPGCNKEHLILHLPLVDVKGGPHL